jgi:hypothetical protein
MILMSRCLVREIEWQIEICFIKFKFHAVSEEFSMYLRRREEFFVVLFF